jgi:hypothetical protein
MQSDLELFFAEILIRKSINFSNFQIGTITAAQQAMYNCDTTLPGITLKTSWLKFPFKYYVVSSI